MKKTKKYGVGGLLAASVLGTVLLSASSASATEGFTCPAGSDTIPVAYAFTSDGQPLLAGTVCVASFTTRLVTVDVEPGWTFKVKSDGTDKNARTEVQFTQTATGDHVELRYQPGLTRIR
jgi:hypothetical protein